MIKLTRIQNSSLEIAKKDGFLGLPVSMSAKTANLLHNAFWEYCGQINFPFVEVHRDYFVEPKKKGVFAVSIDFFTCNWGLTKSDFNQLLQRAAYRDTKEENKARILKLKAWMPTNCNNETMGYIALLDQYEVVKTARNLVCWLKHIEPLAEKGNFKPDRDILPLLNEPTVYAKEIYYLYFSRKQKAFHIFNSHETRWCGVDWRYLCRDQYEKIIAFIKEYDAENSPIWKLDAWKAEDFYAKWSEETFGVNHWDRFAFETVDQLLNENEIKTQKGENMVKLFKDGKSLAVQTDITEEREFTRNFALALQDFITSPQFDGTHEIEHYLKAHTEICCKLRGYKAEVRTQQIMTVGEINPMSDKVVTVTENGNVQSKEAAA